MVVNGLMYMDGVGRCNSNGNILVNARKGKISFRIK
jgi:hypothetical protein